MPFSSHQLFMNLCVLLTNVNRILVFWYVMLCSGTSQTIPVMLGCLLNDQFKYTCGPSPVILANGA
jgi:hypothetical protein